VAASPESSPQVTLRSQARRRGWRRVKAPRGRICSGLTSLRRDTGRVRRRGAGDRGTQILARGHARHDRGRLAIRPGEQVDDLPSRLASWLGNSAGGESSVRRCELYAELPLIQLFGRTHSSDSRSPGMSRWAEACRWCLACGDARLVSEHSRLPPSTYRPRHRSEYLQQSAARSDRDVAPSAGSF